MTQVNSRRTSRQALQALQALQAEWPTLLCFATWLAVIGLVVWTSLTQAPY